MMAEVVSELPGDKKSSARDYTKYLDGQVWKLTLGVDCHASANTAHASIYAFATRAGIKVKIKRRAKAENALYVQAIRIVEAAK
jgi:hypothetical protein